MLPAIVSYNSRPPYSIEEISYLFSLQNHVEIDQTAQQIFAELVAEKETLAKAVASLNTVRRRGKANVNILEMEEEEEIDE